MPLNTESIAPKRVFMTSDAVGGVWTYTLELTRYLHGRGTEVHICVLGPGPNAIQTREAVSAGTSSVEASGLPLEWTAGSERELDILSNNLQARALGLEADLVHLNAPAQTGMRNWPLPLMVSAHSCVGTWWAAAGKGPMPPDLAWRARRTGVGMTLADAVIAPSKAFARELASIYGEIIPITAVYNGRSSGKAEHAPHGRDGIVLTAGRLWDFGKNMGVVDEAAKISGEDVYAAGPQQGPNGETADLAHLRLLGTLGACEMAAWYRRASIFISMSKYEPFGLAVLEAAQAGAALVLSDIPTFRELWDGAAIFVEADDTVRLAEVIKILRASPDERGELATAARLRAARYSVAEMGEQTLRVYEHAVRSRNESVIDQRARA